MNFWERHAKLRSRARRPKIDFADATSKGQVGRSRAQATPEGRSRPDMVIAPGSEPTEAEAMRYWQRQIERFGYEAARADFVETTRRWERLHGWEPQTPQPRPRRSTLRQGLAAAWREELRRSRAGFARDRAAVMRFLRSGRALRLVELLTLRLPLRAAVRMVVEWAITEAVNRLTNQLAPPAETPGGYQIPSGWTEVQSCGAAPTTHLYHVSPSHNIVSTCGLSYTRASSRGAGVWSAAAKTSNFVVGFQPDPFTFEWTTTGQANRRGKSDRKWQLPAGPNVDLIYIDGGPETRTVPLAPPVNLLDPLPQPIATPRSVATPGESLTGVGATPAGAPYGRPNSPAPPRPSGHKYQPPGPGQREVKQHIRNQGLLSAVLRLAEMVTEGADAVGAFYEALPKCRLQAIYNELGRQPNPYEQAKYVWKHAAELNVPLALFNYAHEQITDVIDARAAPGPHVSRRLGFEYAGAQSRSQFRLTRGNFAEGTRGSPSGAVEEALTALVQASGAPEYAGVKTIRSFLRRADVPCQ